MAVIHGSKARAYMNGYDIGDFIQEIKSSHVKTMHDRTVLNNDGAKAYKAGLRSGNFTGSGFYDADTTDGMTEAGITDADTGDYLLEAAIRLDPVDTVICHFPGGASLVGARGIGAQGCVTSYEIEGNQGELLTASFEMESDVGREHIKLLLPKGTITDSVDGDDLDNGADTANGGSGYIQVFGYTSGDVEFTIEHSDDGLVWATLITFTTIDAAHSSERVTVDGAVEQHVRAFADGTFEAEVLVAFYRKP